jgi:membrane fusion protein (multidrug efflux system)
VTNVSLRPGSVVAAYQPLFSLIDASEWWVSANFKETDLVRIAPGMAVTVSVDMLPGRTFAGHVDSVGMGSGATFALLPAQNASGNWVKVTQRFPLRVALDAVDPGLKVGASATVTVDTTGASPSP